jgi:uncharacterized protein YciI
MIFVLHCRMEQGQAPRLPEFRPQHLAYVQSSGIKILGAGPTLSEDGTEIIGGVYIFDVADRAAALAFYNGDPYVREGLWKSTLLERFDKRV